MPLNVGSLFLREGRLSQEQLSEADAWSRENHASVARALVALGLVDDEEIAEVVSKTYRYPPVDLRRVRIDPALLRRVPAESARKYRVMPVSRLGPVITLAMADPTNLFAIDDVRHRSACSNVEIVVASENAIDEAIEKHYGSEKGLSLLDTGVTPAAPDAGGSPKELDLGSIGGLEGLGDMGGVVEEEATPDFDTEDSIDISKLRESAEDSTTVDLMNRLLVWALQRGASDIHIEPYERYFRVRLRVDGVLEEIAQIPNAQRDPLLQRIKIMANLNIAERRIPQGGRFKRRIHHEGRSRSLDYRVSVLPTLWGEKAVLRLLDKTKLMLDMTKLGFEPESLERFQGAISKPYGIVLVTGPTGSGKTNTLYSALQSLNRKDTNIMTAEDPVEFDLEGINQVQIRDEVGLGFATTLREFLRQDPNVILVGEIRDYETAEIAVKASLTGHLVLSTLHTNDAPSTISRMVNMGIEPFLVGTAVNLIQAQRLVRRICSSCKTEVTEQVKGSELLELGFDPAEIGDLRVHAGTGCEACRNTGYKGRVGLYEVMEMSDALRDLAMVGATSVEIQKKALEEGMLTLRMSGLQKIRDGVTTIEEVRRETVGQGATR